jgi:cobalamin biosynthesis protein CobT
MRGARVHCAMLCTATNASALERVQTKTRVWGFEFASALNGPCGQSGLSFKLKGAVFRKLSQKVLAQTNIF